MLNAAQIEYWNAEAGARWVTHQERIDATFEHITQEALTAANPRPGEIVLDIGCGCGATVLELARRVAPNGRVTGIDVSEPMLAVAAARAHEGVNIDLVLADASTHALPQAAFDLAFSRFGVMFFENPIDAFANVRRSLRPGGRLMFMCWRELAANPWFSVPLGAATPLLPPQAPADPEAPGPLAFANPDRVRYILQGAGFSSIAIEQHDTMMALGGPNSLEAAAEFTMQLGHVSRAVAGADEATRARVKSAITEVLRALERPEGIFLGASLWFVSAKA